MKVKSTADVSVPEKLIDQIIGQDKAVNIIKKAARQKRNVLLIGPPGTGKSMMAQAMAELMEKEELEDVLVYPNQNNENQPLVRVLKTYPTHEYLSKNKDLLRYYTPAELTKIKSITDRVQLAKILKNGLGRRLINYQKPKEETKGPSSIFIIGILGLVLLAVMFSSEVPESAKLLITVAILGLGLLFIVSNATAGLGKRLMIMEQAGPKLIVDNSDRFIAPFVDGTSSRAGSLLGDIKHDPLQTFFPTTTIFKKQGNSFTPMLMKHLVDELIEKYPNLVQHDEKYEGLALPKEEEIYTIGHKDGKIKPVRILCVNRRRYKGKMNIVKSGSNCNRLIVTPEHRIYANGNYTEARLLDGKEELVHSNEPVITKEDIIRTFSDVDQKSAFDYYHFIRIKSENPKFGYKKAAKILGIKPGQVRWWNNGKNRPSAIRTIERLEELRLLPFYPNNKLAPIVARVLGTTFGDGGIFSTLNAIFLSSSEEDTLNQYAQDLIAIFGEGIGKNFERRISGINNTGMCVWNTNRDIVRFFLALGAPLGRKNKKITFPSWVYLNEETQKEFFAAILGNELCSPRYSPHTKTIQYFGIGLAGDISLKENRLHLLREIAYYLDSYGVKTGQINQNEFRKGRYIWRLGISHEIKNVMRFYELILIRYSNAKTARIAECIEHVLQRKKSRNAELSNWGECSRSIAVTLRVSENMLQKILVGQKPSFDHSMIEFSGMIYNITTESGNLFANGILASNSGGLGTPAHLRVEAGAIHHSNKGVLFIDEVASMKMNWQQEILTAMQEKKYPITGQSEMSSGALVKTQPVPTDFVLVASGNLPDATHIHPALRSRIRGAGYEVYVEDTMEDTPESEENLIRFIAQEIKRDGKIPHFDEGAISEIIEEARKMSGRRKRFTLNLRELGGLVRAAGDVAREKNKTLVTKEDIFEARILSSSIESQLGAKIIEHKKEYQTLVITGAEIGRVNGLAVLGDARAGLVLPIVAEATPAASKSEGRVIATGKLGVIAKEAVDNVSAIFKKYIGTAIARTDLHIQFLQTYEGVEGDSASISTAVAVISALSNIPVNQGVAMTGSLDVRGRVLPVGGITSKIEAAIEAGIKKVLIPRANAQDVYVKLKQRKDLEIIEVDDLSQVLEHALSNCAAKKILLQKIKRQSH